MMAYKPTPEELRDEKIIQDFYDRLGTGDLTFYEALSVLEQTKGKLEAEMYRRHINSLE